MANDGGHNGSQGSNANTEALREEIRQTRAELGETVQALAAKADVKGRVKESATHTADRVRAQAAQTADKVKDSAAQAAEHAKVSAYEARDLARRSPVPWFAVAGVAAVLAVILVIRGRRR